MVEYRHGQLFPECTNDTPQVLNCILNLRPTESLSQEDYHDYSRFRQPHLRARPRLAQHAQVLVVRRGVGRSGQLEERGTHLQPGRASADYLGRRRQLRVVLGRGHLLGQPPRHLHRAERQRLARGQGLPHRDGVHARRRDATHARQQAGALAVVHRDALQHAVRPRHRPQRGDVRLRRLRRPPRPQVQRRRRAAAIVGQAGHRPGRVRAGAQRVGGQGQPRADLRPRERPHPGFRRPGRLSGGVDRP